MNLNLIFSGKAAINTDAETKQGSAKKAYMDFGSFLDKASDSDNQRTFLENDKKTSKDNNNTQTLKKATQTKKNNADRKEDFSKKNDKVSIDKSDKSKDIKDNIKDNKEEVASVAGSTAKTKEESNQPIISEDKEKLAVEELAECLKVSVDRVAEILNSLNIKVFELSDSSKLNEFMQKLHGVETPIGLLAVPNVKEQITEVDKLINEINNLIDGVDNPINGVDKLINELKEIPDELLSKNESEQVGAEADLTTDVINISKEVVNIHANNQKNVNHDVAEMQETAEDKTNATMATQNNAEAVVTMLSDMTDSKMSENNQQRSQQDFDFVNIIGGGQEHINGNHNIMFREVQARTFSTANVNTNDVVNQIMEKMKVEFKGDVSEIKIILKPENLGEVALKVATENGIVTAQFVAENERVKEIIEANFNQLKDTLQQLGLSVSELSVSVGQDQAQQRMDQFQRDRQKNSRRIQRIIGSIASENETAETDVQKSIITENAVDVMA